MYVWEVSRANCFNCRKLKTGFETERCNSLLLANVRILTEVEEPPVDGATIKTT